MKKTIFILLLILVLGFSLRSTFINYKEFEELMLNTAEEESFSCTPSTEDVLVYEYIGNVNSMIFHCPDCHTLPYEKNRIYFNVRTEATEQGYKPCENCTP